MHLNLMKVPWPMQWQEASDLSDAFSVDREYTGSVGHAGSECHQYFASGSTGSVAR